MPETRCIVVFPSTHMALRAERAARAAGIAVRMVPAPRHLSADCNVGMEAAEETSDALRAVLAAGNVQFRMVMSGT